MSRLVASASLALRHLWRPRHDGEVDRIHLRGCACRPSDGLRVPRKKITALPPWSPGLIRPSFATIALCPAVSPPLTSASDDLGTVFHDPSGEVKGQGTQPKRGDRAWVNPTQPSGLYTLLSRPHCGRNVARIDSSGYPGFPFVRHWKGWAMVSAWGVKLFGEDHEPLWLLDSEEPDAVQAFGLALLAAEAVERSDLVGINSRGVIDRARVEVPEAEVPFGPRHEEPLHLVGAGQPGEVGVVSPVPPPRSHRRGGCRRLCSGTPCGSAWAGPSGGRLEYPAGLPDT